MYIKEGGQKCYETTGEHRLNPKQMKIQNPNTTKSKTNPKSQGNR